MIVIYTRPHSSLTRTFYSHECLCSNMIQSTVLRPINAPNSMWVNLSHFAVENRKICAAFPPEIFQTFCKRKRMTFLWHLWSKLWDVFGEISERFLLSISAEVSRCFCRGLSQKRKPDFLNFSFLRFSNKTHPPFLWRVVWAVWFRCDRLASAFHELSVGMEIGFSKFLIIRNLDIGVPPMLEGFLLAS